MTILGYECDGACGFWLWVTIIMVPVNIGIIWYCWTNDSTYKFQKQQEKTSRAVEAARRLADHILVDMALAFSNNDLKMAREIFQNAASSTMFREMKYYENHRSAIHVRLLETIQIAGRRGETWLGRQPSDELVEGFSEFLHKVWEAPPAKVDPVMKLIHEIYEDIDEKDYVYKRLQEKR